MDSGDKDGTSEEQKGEEMKAAVSGKALDTTAADWSVQVGVVGTQDSSGYFKSAVADIESASTCKRKKLRSSQSGVTWKSGEPDPVCPGISRNPTEEIRHVRYGSDLSG